MSFFEPGRYYKTKAAREEARKACCLLALDSVSTAYDTQEMERVNSV